MMKVKIGTNSRPLRPTTERLLQRMTSPLSGLSPQFGLVMRSVREPKIAITTGTMSGVHAPQGLPSSGAYHIVGVGTKYEEAVIKGLAETIERYALYSSGGIQRQVVIYAPPHRMATNSRVLICENLQYFSATQLSRPGFPCSRLDPATSIGWVSAKSLVDGSICWIPAQTVLMDYAKQENEPQFIISVSTGTAAHTRLEMALKNALLELIQIDAAMGNWYGNQPSLLIELRAHERTAAVESLIERRLCRDGPRLRFYWLPSADLPALSIACVLEDQEVPNFAVGLGCDLCLARAMHKAFLEGVAVAKLAKLNVIRQAKDDMPRVTDPTGFYDLDTNVAYYAVEGQHVLRAKFGVDVSVNPAELPEDVDLGITNDLCHLVDGFKNTGKELVFLDLTTSDIRELGFSVARVWSPHTLTLSLPSAPPVMHPRFQAYGGVTSEAPHPYP